MVEADLLAQISQIATTVVLVGGLVFGASKWLNQQSDRKVARAKSEAEETAAGLRDLTEKVAQQMRNSTEVVNKQMMEKIELVNKTLTEMLFDLKRRADLTNGNVASIRTDQLDLSEDIQELYDLIPQSEEHGGDAKGEINRKTRERERGKRNRNKRRQIESDRVEQSERYLNSSQDSK